MNVRCCFCFTFLLLIHKASSVRVEALEGEEVLLPCSVAQNSQEVYWRDGDTRVVCDIVNGAVDFEDQNPVYKNRVIVFHDEIKKGNVSIILSGVKASDAGTYSCYDPVKDFDETVVLTVKERKSATGRKIVLATTASPEPRNGDSAVRADVVLTFLLGWVLLYSLTF